jgi:hypothetical protein
MTLEEKIKDKFLKYIAFLICLILILSIIDHCSNSKPQYAKVKVPEVKGSFKSIKIPEPIQIPKAPEIVFLWGEKELKIANPLDVSLLQDYTEAKDSIDKLNKYIEAITLRDYEIQNDDENILINNRFKVQGFLKDFQQDYTIKEKSLDVKLPREKFKLRYLMNGGIDSGELTMSLGLGFETKKNNIYSVSYNDNGSFLFGYSGVLFKF